MFSQFSSIPVAETVQSFVLIHDFMGEFPDSRPAG
jgi:hypothetical protein